MKVLMLCPDCQMIDRRVLQEAHSLQQVGHEVVVLSGFECAREEEYEDAGVRVHRYTFDWDDERLKRIARFLPRSPRAKAQVYRTFRRAARLLGFRTSFDVFVIGKAKGFRADAVHVHDLPFLPHGHALAREWGVPLIFDAHEIYHEQDILPQRQRRRLRRMERRLIRHVDVFITVNGALADHYQKLYGKRPLVLMNCAEAPPSGFSDGSRAELRQLAGIGEDATVVLYQGWISGERNLATLVRAAEFLPEETCLLLIGYGEYEKELRAIVEGKAWAPKVRFLGQVVPERILSLTAGADVGVIPYQPIDLNHRYCSPNKFFEYVQTGVPVVAHDLPFFQAMSREHDVLVLGDLSTPEGMADAIRVALSDRERLAKMSENCRLAARRLNWAVEGDKLVSAYAGLLNRRGVGGASTKSSQ